MSAEISLDGSTDSSFDWPTAAELENYYLMLDAGSILELDWQGTRQLQLPTQAEGVKVEQNPVAENVEAQEARPVKNDFDFSDDIAQPQQMRRGQHTTPKSAKKKTANFAGVMEVLKKKSAEGST